MKLSDEIEKKKCQLADFLTKSSERISVQTRKRLLASMGMVMACICVAMMVTPFQNPVSDVNLIPKETMLPAVIVPPDSNEPLISQEDYFMLVDFKKTMDSLLVYDHNTYNEILNGREGLLDSIKYLISLYH